MNPLFRNLLLIVLIFMNISCRTDVKKTANTKTFNSKIQRLSFEYPEKYELKFSTDSSDATANVIISEPLQNNKDAFQEFMAISNEFLPIPLSDSIFHKTSMAQIRIANPDLIVEDKGKIKFDKNEFHQFTFQFKTDDSTAYQVNGFTIVEDSIGYVLNITSQLENQQQFLKNITPILKTFKTIK